MGQGLIAKPYMTPSCDTCDTALGPGATYVEGTAERFCDLTCCRIFYSWPVKVIAQLRKERLQ
jgi:hypothetical protein